MLRRVLARPLSPRFLVLPPSRQCPLNGHRAPKLLFRVPLTSCDPVRLHSGAANAPAVPKPAKAIVQQPQQEIKTSNPMHTQGKEAARITYIGMWVNLSLALSKGIVGTLIHSNALVADAVHSLSDLLTDVVTLYSVRIARLPPDLDHPYGYGKYEAVGSLTVGAILVGAGLNIGFDSVSALQEFWMHGTVVASSALDFFPSMDRHHQLLLAAGAAGLSIGAKEALYHATVRIGRRSKSKVLIANAWHHRTDAISSVVALGGILGMMGGFPMFDPIAGVAVSGMIVKAGGEICLDSVRELTDKSVEAEVLDLLRDVSRNVEDVLHVSNVRARRMGPYTVVDLRVHLHDRTSISMAQKIARRVRHTILHHVSDVSEVLVHTDVMQHPQDSSDQEEDDLLYEQDVHSYHELRQDVVNTVMQIPEVVHVTHVTTHWVSGAAKDKRSGTLVDVTIVLPSHLQVIQAHKVAKKARKAVEAIPYILEADIHLELSDEDGSAADQQHQPQLQQQRTSNEPSTGRIAQARADIAAAHGKAQVD